jgi:CubicO group peptidase (beta-lactamase class C family)
MFAPEAVAAEQGAEPPADAEKTARFALGQPLGYDPGTEFQYENVGYCLLGRVIEAATGTGYESHVRESLLGPLSATQMRIGATRQSG